MPAVNGVGGAVCGRTACTVRRAGVGNGVIGQGHRSGTTRWGNPGHQGFGTYHQMITTAPAPDPTSIRCLRVRLWLGRRLYLAYKRFRGLRGSNWAVWPVRTSDGRTSGNTPIPTASLWICCALAVLLLRSSTLPRCSNRGRTVAPIGPLIALSLI